MQIAHERKATTPRQADEHNVAPGIGQRVVAAALQLYDTVPTLRLAKYSWLKGPSDSAVIAIPFGPELDHDSEHEHVHVHVHVHERCRAHLATFQQ